MLRLLYLMVVFVPLAGLVGIIYLLAMVERHGYGKRRREVLVVDPAVFTRPSPFLEWLKE